MRAKTEDEMSKAESMEDRIKDKVSSVIMELVKTVESATLERARTLALEAVSHGFQGGVSTSAAKGGARRVANASAKKAHWFPSCVVPECKSAGTPRHYGACVAHKDKPKAELLKLKKSANESGGKNFGWKRGVGMPRGRKVVTPEETANTA